jgi:hypothetical protein
MTAKRAFLVMARGLALVSAIILGLLIAGITLIWWSESRLKAKINFITFSKIDKAQNFSKGEGVKVAICDWLFDSRTQASDEYTDPASMIPGEPVGTDKPWHGGTG